MRNCDYPRRPVQTNLLDNSIGETLVSVVPTIVPPGTPMPKYPRGRICVKHRAARLISGLADAPWLSHGLEMVATDTKV
jgi:hypothetical protein